MELVKREMRLGEINSEKDFEQVAQDQVSMVASAQVAERIEGVVGTLAADGAKTKSQVGVVTYIDQAGLDGNGTGDG